MRCRELLNVMRERLDEGERAYAKLFSKFSPDEIAATKEKDMQWKLAEAMVDDASLSQLRRTVGKMRFDARELERGFEELDGIIAMTQVE